MRATARNLFFDADDTLWENNALYERVIDDYLDWLAHPTFDRAELRRILAEVEEANIAAHGYGSRIFLRSLGDCFERLMQRPVGPDERARLDELGAAFTSGQVELIPSVATVLGELAGRYRLFLVTKGDVDEQQRKIDASGLAGFFEATEIVPVKIAETYRDLVARHALDAATTWMIGNSPRSDILPARAAGLGAVFIPNASTWAHEHAELDPADPGIVTLSSFTELTGVF